MRSFFAVATEREAEEGIRLTPMTDDNVAIWRGSRKRNHNSWLVGVLVVWAEKGGNIQLEGAAGIEKRRRTA